ncbi:hypothetical protein [Sphingobium tyrosinilyticum]|uniref:Uncharacterized protein n=1 Tax=Sphingobium tyrosinilyticum TaxID=2715436 RepID=A0ABV9EYN3_9SPHN
MRRDARKLLEKLNRTDFAYREFEDSFSETELWPIFAAVLGDHSVVGDAAATLPSARTGKAQAATAPAWTREQPSPPDQIFANYGVTPLKGGTKKGVDLHDFFNRFSDLD